MRKIRQYGKDAFASLKIYNYRLFFLGQMISLSGTWMQTVAQSWLVLELSASGMALGALAAFQFLPVLLFGAWGGVLADRFSKRKILYFTQSVSAVLAILLGALVAARLIQVWMVYLLALGLGLTNAIDNPARQTFVFEMVGKDYVKNAVSLNGILFNTARIIGPAVGGILIAAVGLAPCFFLNGASFVAVLLALFLMETKSLFPAPVAEKSKGQLQEGLRYVKSVPILRDTILMMAIIGTLTYEYTVSLPLIAKFTFSGNGSTYAELTVAMGLGSILGGLVVAGQKKLNERMLIASAFFLGLSTLFASLMPSFSLTLAGICLVGYFSTNFIPRGNALLQLNSEPGMRGRVLSLWAIAFLGSTPIGGPVVGWIGEFAGPRWSLAIGGVAAILAAALAYRTHSKTDQASFPAGNPDERPGQ
ncbi:MAG: MFS transporter [Syntrophobacteraceae bacterium]|nr:MFS transporter [Syntrophobacteraceae bacterium]